MNIFKLLKAKKKLDTIVSLAPIAMAVGVPVGRYVLEKVLDKNKVKARKKPDIYK